MREQIVIETGSRGINKNYKTKNARAYRSDSTVKNLLELLPFSPDIISRVPVSDRDFVDHYVHLYTIYANNVPENNTNLSPPSVSINSGCAFLLKPNCGRKPYNYFPNRFAVTFNVRINKRTRPFLVLAIVSRYHSVVYICVYLLSGSLILFNVS